MPVTPTAEGFWQLYGALLKKGIEEQYGGHEDYHVMLDAVDSDIPIYSGDVTIRKENPDTGQIYTVTYHVKVWDDMGHVIEGPDDIGGRCFVDKKIIAKGYIFTCKRCGRFYCSEHVRFFKGKDDEEVGLCWYGPSQKSGCFYLYEHEYLPEPIDLKIKRLKKEAQFAHSKREREEARAAFEQAERERKEARGPSLITRIFKGFAIGGSASLCQCGWKPVGGYAATCPRCGRQSKFNAEDPKICKFCFEPIKEIPCRCGRIIHV